MYEGAVAIVKLVPQRPEAVGKYATAKGLCGTSFTIATAPFWLTMTDVPAIFIMLYRMKAFPDNIAGIKNNRESLCIYCLYICF